MKERQAETDNRKKLKMKLVFADGCERFTFIQVEDEKRITILYALTDKDAESHEAVYQEAIAQELIDEEIEPSGGGIFNAKDGTYYRSSHSFDEASPRVLNYIDHWFLSNVVPCNERGNNW